MKPLPLFLALSLAANAALVAVLVLSRPESAPKPPVPGTAPVRRPGAAVAPTAGPDRAGALVAALAAGDAAALTAAGVPAEVVRQLAAVRAFARLFELGRTLDRPPPPDPTEYWRNRGAVPRPPPTREQRLERLQAEREFDRAMRAAFGPDWAGDTRAARYSFLPETKRDQLLRIERDYEEMQREVSLDADGFQLAADRAKTRLLNAEKERDLAAALTPAEREQLELRNSRTAQNLINRYGDVIASEEEYRRLYARQKAFDDRYATDDWFSRPRTPEENRARAEAERQLNDDLRALLGEDRWGALARTNDGEYRTLTTLAARLGQPAALADQVYALRDAYAAQSAALNQNAALSAADRKTIFAELANRARADLRARLGADGAEAYLPRASWVQMLQGGTAFTTDPRQLPPGSPRPGGGTSVFPLPAPPRPPVPAGKP
jgi:hypothetical protein